MRDHLLWKGFVEDYYDWRYHYDIATGESSSANFVFVTEELNIPRIGVELLAEFNIYGMKKVYEDDAREYKDYYSQWTVGWKKKSVFWDLPYWKTNMSRHCLDVMHIVKNFFDNIFNTVMRAEKGNQGSNCYT